MANRKYPEVFQGNIKKKNYFEGWYNKIVNSSQNHIYSFIPTIALNKKTSHSAIQIFDAFKTKYYYIQYPLSSFKNLSRTRYHIKIGNSIFSESGMNLEIRSENLFISGNIKYYNMVKWPKKFLQPGVMGWLSYFPFLETYHGIVSMNHGLKGNLKINDEEISFDGGKGYIEKDWGKSFPTAWIWMHSNHFLDPQVSFMFSVAKIPFFSFKATGFLCILLINKIFYKFTTYNASKIEKLVLSENTVNIDVSNSKYHLSIKAISGKTSNMKAPIRGKMSANCIESMNSIISLSLYKKNKKKIMIIFKDVGRSAGLEIMDNGEF